MERDDAVIARLVESHRKFLAFLERHVDSPQTAEDILQESFVKAVRKRDTLREEDNVVAWFYQLLRNALTDHYRRRAAAARGRERAQGDAATELAFEEDLHEAVCACLYGLLPNLKAEYADAVRRIDLDGVDIGHYSGEHGISAGNARVRLHRGRKALQRELVRACGTCAAHGCLDCTCGG